MIVATLAVLVLSPLILLVSALAIRWLPGRWRGLRLMWFLLVYLMRESAGLVALFVLWVVSGFGWRLSSDHMQRAHVVLAGWYLRGVVGSARKVLGLRIVTEQIPDHLVVSDPFRSDSGAGNRPVLVFSRHAGAGDSFVLVDLLINTYGRRPLIVMKDLLQLDPCVDVVLNRLPSRFIQTDPPPGGGVIESIADLASGLGSDGALILFPEGGNFTQRRRTHAIERLHGQGLEHLVPHAEALVHVLPPRPGGAFAAIDAARDADVLFVAHTGLEQLSSPRDLWRGLPMRSEVRMTWWSVPAAEVPVDPAARTIWLYDWWDTIDQWIEDHHVPDAPVGHRLEVDRIT